jgi:phosphonatase-like hydrolase
MNIELVAFDVAGTVLNDDGLVIKAFKNAFESSQPELWPIHGEQWTQYAIDTMGQSKIHVFTELLGDAEKAVAANVAFEAAYLAEMAENGASPIEGAEDLFAYLKNKGIAVALTTGFSRTTLDVIINKLGWTKLIDLSVTPDEAGRGRPHPDMLNMAIEVLGITTPSNTVVCGDTAADMQAAVAFGAAQIIGVLTGAHDEQLLRNAGATSVVNSVANLKTLI